MNRYGHQSLQNRRTNVRRNKSLARNKSTTILSRTIMMKKTFLILIIIQVAYAASCLRQAIEFSRVLSLKESVEDLFTVNAVQEAPVGASPTIGFSKNKAVGASAINSFWQDFLKVYAIKQFQPLQHIAQSDFQIIQTAQAGVKTSKDGLFTTINILSYFEFDV